MEINGNVIQNQMVLAPARVWEAVKGWAKEHITQEAMFDASLALATTRAAVPVAQILLLRRILRRRK